MESKRGYLARAWADLTADERWWQVILLLGVVNCVPVVGQVFAMGYLLDWAKEGAWGMTSPLPREVGDFKRKGTYGLIWIVVALVWMVPVWIAGQLLGLVPALGPVLRVLADIAMVAAFVVSTAAAIRGVVYERILPGLQVGRVLRMAARDVEGLARVFCILLIEFIVAVAALLLVMIPAAPFIVSISGITADGIFGVDLIPVLVFGIVTIVTSLVVWIAASVCATCVMALYVRAMGYWVGQFEPDRWGAPNEPMPFEREQGSPEPPAGSANGDAPDDRGAGSGETGPAAESDVSADSGSPAGESVPRDRPAESDARDDPASESAQPGPASPDAPASTGGKTAGE